MATSDLYVGAFGVSNPHVSPCPSRCHQGGSVATSEPHKGAWGSPPPTCPHVPPGATKKAPWPPLSPTWVLGVLHKPQVPTSPQMPPRRLHGHL